MLAVSLSVFLTEASAETIPVKAAVHVHTTFSTGALSLEEVAEQARRARLDAVILSDNFLLRVEYGLFPLPGLLKAVEERPSALRAGMTRYLKAIDDAQARFPDVILVPGVEVIPYYYWTGLPWNHDLTLWDLQKNLLVVGLARPEDYEAIPAIGNVRTFERGGARLITCGLGLGALGAGLLVLTGISERCLRLRHFTLRVRRRRWGLGLSTLGAGALLVLDSFNWSAVAALGGPRGIEPYQHVIDYAESRGGAVLWSFPEARDLHRVDVGHFGTVLVQTEPYPEVLLQSRAYTGLGAVYPDTVTFTEPGRQWDQLLLEYSGRRRERPAWAVGELGYHEPPKRFDEAVTVFLVRERSRAAILESLKGGRLYALAPLPDHHLVLADFSMRQTQQTGWTGMGGEFGARGQAPLLISVRVASSDGRAAPFVLRLIRSGSVDAVVEGTTPFQRILQAKPPRLGSREFFRVEITKPHRLLSNPIFVEARA
jgi:hypothetical protein